MSKNLVVKQIAPKHRAGDFVKISQEIIAASSLKGIARIPKGMEFKVINVAIADSVVKSALPYYKDVVRSCFEYELQSVGDINAQYSDGSFGILGGFYFTVNGDFIRPVDLEKKEKQKKDTKTSFLDLPLTKDQKFPKAEPLQLKNEEKPKDEKQAKPKKSKKNKKKNAAADMQTH